MLLIQLFMWTVLLGLVQHRAIVSTDMQPTLVMGEVQAFANRGFFGVVGASSSPDPSRGDVVLVRVPAYQPDFVKRVIGLPGETVQMRAGRLYIDGQLVERQRLGVAEERNSLGEPMAVTRYRELLPDAPGHLIQEIDDLQVLDDTPAFTIPPAHYFVMGDNRDNSMDSRVPDSVGFVRRSDVIAKWVPSSSGDAQ